MSTTTRAANVDLCIKVQCELFGAGRLELADELIATDCVDHGGESGPGGSGRAAGAARGREAIKDVVRWLRGAFGDLTYEIEDALGDSDRVAIRCTARGTHEGRFLGREPTGRNFAVEQIHMYRVSNGQIAEHWAARDDVGMMHQLGLAG